MQGLLHKTFGELDTLVHILYSRTHQSWAQMEIVKYEVFKCLENAILESFIAHLSTRNWKLPSL